MNDSNSFVVYDYITKEVKKDKETMVIDCYKSFGWEFVSSKPSYFSVVLSFKRDKDLKDIELSTLQREMEKALDEIENYESQKGRGGYTLSLTIGVIGALILGGGMSLITFSTTTIWVVLGIVIGIIGLIICGINIPILRKVNKDKTARITELIEEKQKELASILVSANQIITVA